MPDSWQGAAVFSGDETHFKVGNVFRCPKSREPFRSSRILICLKAEKTRWNNAKTFDMRYQMLYTYFGKILVTAIAQQWYRRIVQWKEYESVLCDEVSAFCFVWSRLFPFCRRLMQTTRSWGFSWQMKSCPKRILSLGQQTTAKTTRTQNRI